MKYLKRFEDMDYDDPFVVKSRRVSLNGKVEDILTKYAPWYDLSNSDNLIYRGIRSSGNNLKNVYIIHPKEHYRYSLDTYNIYNLIIDNSEYWKDYPKRSKSIICTTNSNYAKKFGEVYRVIPFKKASKFGKCPNDDIFDSFNLKTIDKHIYDLEDMDDYLVRTFKFPEHPISDYKELNKILSKDNLDFFLNSNETSSGVTVGKIDKIVEIYGSYLKYLEYLMQPERNGFSIFKYTQKKQMGWKSSHEVWCEDPCLLIKESYIQKLIA